MLDGLIRFLSQIFFLVLHVTGSGGFPRALSAPAERKAMEEMAPAV